MSKSWTIVGTTAPLFDRLVDDDLNTFAEVVPFIKYNREETIASVMREATHLLNTRCKIPWKEYQALDPSTLEYGLPDLYGFPDQSYGDASSPEGANKLARLMANSLKLFEPRLESVSVEISQYDPQTQNLYLQVHGMLKIGDVLEPISFPVAVQHFQDIGRREKKAYNKDI